jgi:hypothetical protein
MFFKNPGNQENLIRIPVQDKSLFVQRISPLPMTGSVRTDFPNEAGVAFFPLPFIQIPQ